MTEAATDFLVFIIVMAVVAAMAVGLMLGIQSDVKDLEKSQIYDKTAGELIGDTSGYSKYYYYSAYDVSLAIARQGAFMPAPKRIRVGTRVFSVDTDALLSYNSDVAENVYRAMESWYGQFMVATKDQFVNVPDSLHKAEFDIKYNGYGTETTDDDYYSVLIKLHDGSGYNLYSLEAFGNVLYYESVKG